MKIKLVLLSVDDYYMENEVSLPEEISEIERLVNVGDVIDDKMSFDNVIVMPSFVAESEESIFCNTIALLKTEGYVIYETMEQYQDIISTVANVKNENGVEYNCIYDLGK